MDFFIRLFSKTDKRLQREVLLGAFYNQKNRKGIVIEEEKTSTHNHFLVKKKNKELLMIIELLPKLKDEDNAKLNEIIFSLKEKKPKNSAKWMEKYLKKTKSIYEFVPLLDLESAEDWDIVTELYHEAWVYLRGVYQIKDEGFTNESGDIILWDFPFSATGQRVMAVKTITGRWKTFLMDLESTIQRKSFFRGRLPKKTKPIFRG